MNRDHAVCSQCATGKMRATTEVVVRELEALSFEASIPAWRCEQCGNLEFDGPSLRLFEELIAAEIEKCGAQNGTAFKFLRKSAGLRAAELADLLDVDAATISRWETNKVPVDRAAMAVLGAILREQAQGKNYTLQHLVNLKNPHTPPARRTLHPIEGGHAVRARLQ